MSFPLDETDIAILESLMKDGRKSFRQISREVKVSTPTVQIRYERMKNMGRLKAVSPLLNMKKLRGKIDVSQTGLKSKQVTGKKLEPGMHVVIPCDYCERKISEKPSILKIANFQRFFCCPSCRILYKEKYKRRIQVLIDSQQKNLK